MFYTGIVIRGTYHTYQSVNPPILNTILNNAHNISLPNDSNMIPF